MPAKASVPAAGIHGLHPGLGSPALLAPALQSLVSGLRSYVGSRTAGSQPRLPLLAATPPSSSASQPAAGQRLPAVSAQDAAQSPPLPQTAALPQHTQSLSMVHATQSSRPASLPALLPDAKDAAGVPSTSWTGQAAPVPATVAAATLTALPSVPVANQFVQPLQSASRPAASPAAVLPSLNLQVSPQTVRPSAAPDAAQPPAHTVAQAAPERLPVPLPSAAALQVPRPALPPASWLSHTQAGARFMLPPPSPVAAMAMLQSELSALVSQLQVGPTLHLAHCELLRCAARRERRPAMIWAMTDVQAMARCFPSGFHPAFILRSGGADEGTTVEHSYQGQADEDQRVSSACQLRQTGPKSPAQAAPANYCSDKHSSNWRCIAHRWAERPHSTEAAAGGEKCLLGLLAVDAVLSGYATSMHHLHCSCTAQSTPAQQLSMVWSPIGRLAAEDI